MARKRRQYSPEFKFKVALEAAKGRKTISELASELEVHPILQPRPPGATRSCTT